MKNPRWPSWIFHSYLGHRWNIDISDCQQHVNKISNANDTFILIGYVMVRIWIPLFTKKFKMAVKDGCQYRYLYHVFWGQTYRNTNPTVDYIFPIIGINLMNSNKTGEELNNSLIIVIVMKNPRWRPEWQPQFFNNDVIHWPYTVDC